MHIYRTMVPGSGSCTRSSPGTARVLPVLWTPPQPAPVHLRRAISMSPPERSCSNPTRPIRWPSFWLTDRLPIASSRWNDGSTN